MNLCNKIFQITSVLSLLQCFKTNSRRFHLQYMDCDSIFLNFDLKDIIIDLSKINEFIDFSNLDGNSELLSNVKKKHLLVF